jgi:predicted house-cleaning NTP pyrophosphatase (Maf/HAM1 superfamily)
LALILASTSPIRRSMLESAGVDHAAVAPGVDESPFKHAASDPKAIASELAAAKALAVSARSADAWVIGSEEWPEVGYCVGVFRMEARGVQLFDRIQGDHFTILGMPLLPLLAALRQRGVLPA